MMFNNVKISSIALIKIFINFDFICNNIYNIVT